MQMKKWVSGLLGHLLAGSLVSILVLPVATVNAQPDPLEWINQIAEGSQWEPAITADSSGNTIVVGKFSASATFEGQNLTTQSDVPALFPTGGILYLAKYDPQGELLWVTQAGGEGATCKGRAVTTDSAGNILVTGYFYGPVTFGLGEQNVTDLVNVAYDIFVAKYDPDGNLLWARRDGGPYHDEGYAIAADGSGNFFVTGYVGGDPPPWGPIEATFGDAPGQVTLGIEAYRAIFVAKYDSSGAVIWAKEVDGYYPSYPGYGYGRGVVADGNGDCLATGYFNRTATFGPGETNVITFGVFNDDFDEMFVAKYTGSDGSLLWANSTDAATSFRQGYGISTDSDGNGVVTGAFSGSTDFNAAGDPVVLEGNGDMFLAKYAPDGTLVWVRKDGGDTAAAEGWSIASDGSDNMLVTGYFSTGDAVFGAGEDEETVLVRAGSSDVFVAKYDPSGNLLWAKSEGGPGVDEGWGIASDGSGNALVTGIFRDTVTFGEGEPNATTLTVTQSKGYRDAFVMKLQAPTQPFEVIDIDVKFCSNPNALNCRKKGGIPVTVFGKQGFEVSEIELSSLRLCLPDLTVCTELAPKDSSIADRGDPTTDLGAAQCAVVEGIEQDYLHPDGWDDLDAVFEAQDVIDSLFPSCGDLDKGTATPTVVLHGNTTGGRVFLSHPMDDVGVDQLLKQR